MEDNNDPIMNNDKENDVIDIPTGTSNSNNSNNTVNNTVNNTSNANIKKSNTNALISFIASLVGLVIAGLPLGIVAIVTGVNGMRTFNPETENNKWMAIFGLVLGIIDVVAVMYFLSITKAL